MADHDGDLGSHVRTHRLSGGIVGFGHKRSVTKVSWIVFGACIGFVPGLFVALFTDLIAALFVGAVLGALAGYVLSARISQEAAVTEARVYAGGVVFVDARGEHPITWDRVAGIQGRHTQNVLGAAPFVDIKGRVDHAYVIRVADGTGYWLDDRLADVARLATDVAQASGVQITPMR